MQRKGLRSRRSNVVQTKETNFSIGASTSRGFDDAIIELTRGGCSRSIQHARRRLGSQCKGSRSNIGDKLVSTRLNCKNGGVGDVGGGNEL